MANRKYVEPINLIKTRVLFKNLDGHPDMLNREGGKRSITLQIDDAELAFRRKEEGWNIRPIDRDTKFEDGPWKIDCKIGFDRYPPKIVKVVLRANGEYEYFDVKTPEDLSDIQDLDIIEVTATISPNTYNDRNTGEERLSAWIREMVILVKESMVYGLYGRPNNNCERYLAETEAPSEDDIPF